MLPVPGSDLTQTCLLCQGAIVGSLLSHLHGCVLFLQQAAVYIFTQAAGAPNSSGHGALDIALGTSGGSMYAHGGYVHVAMCVTTVQSLPVCAHHFVCTYNIGSLALLSHDASFASSVHLSELSCSGRLGHERLVLTLPFVLCLLLFLVSGSTAMHAAVICVLLNFNVFSWWAYGLASKSSEVDCLSFCTCAAWTPCYALTSFVMTKDCLLTSLENCFT